MNVTFPSAIEGFLNIGRNNYHYNYHSIHREGTQFNLIGNRVFSNRLMVDFTKDIVEIPISVFGAIDCFLSDKALKGDNTNILLNSEIYVPYITAEDTTSRYRNRATAATGPTFFKKLRSYMELPELCTFSCKENIYKAIRGLILDSSDTPILLATAIMDKKTDLYNNTFFSIRSFKIYVHPKIYSSDGVIEKYIKGTFISSAMEWSTPYKWKDVKIPIVSFISQEDYTDDDTVSMEPLKLEISTDICNFTRKPAFIIPHDINKGINDFLAEHVDEIEL